MPDPKLQRIADALRASHRPAGTPAPAVAPALPPLQVTLPPEAYRVDRFMRRVAQLQEPALRRQVMQAQALRGGRARSSGEEIPQ